MLWAAARTNSSPRADATRDHMAQRPRAAAQGVSTIFSATRRAYAAYASGAPAPSTRRSWMRSRGPTLRRSYANISRPFSPPPPAHPELRRVRCARGGRPRRAERAVEGAQAAPWAHRAVASDLGARIAADRRHGRRAV